MNELFSDTFSTQEHLEDAFRQAIQRGSGVIALALFDLDGQLCASALPEDADPKTLAAMAATVASLGQRVSQEYLRADLSQVYVEGDGGFAILRAVSEGLVLLIIAARESNLALILHDVAQVQAYVAENLDDFSPADYLDTLVSEQDGDLVQVQEEAQLADPLDRRTEVDPVPERLYQPTHLEATLETPDERLCDLQAKLDSLDLGFFPERVAAIRDALDEAQHLEWIEAELIALELDVMAEIEGRAADLPESPLEEVQEEPIVPAEPKVSEQAAVRPVESVAYQQEPETVDETDFGVMSPISDSDSIDQNSSVRRALKWWLASMIESEE